MDERKSIPEKSRVFFRGVQGECDYSLLLENVRSSRHADKIMEAVSLNDVAHTYALSEKFDPARQVLIASLEDAPAESIGHSRLGWYSSCADDRLYFQISWLREEFRHSAFWPEMIRQNDKRLREIAREHPPVPRRFLQAWASDNQVDWISALESTGYQAVRHFNNMLYLLDKVPERPLPVGVEIRPVRTEHMHTIWEAMRDLNDGLFENVDEDWLEEKYPDWLENPSHTPQYWQVAWDGDRLAGMVLARIDPDENKEKNRQRGYTEHVYVRPDWRKRGLANALLARSLQVLKEEGMQDAELGVDAENESGAFELYQRMGFQTYYVDIWFRKSME